MTPRFARRIARPGSTRGAAVAIQGAAADDGRMAGQPLIGVDDLATPEWAKGYEATAQAGLRAIAREAPRTVAIAVQWRGPPTVG